MQRLSLVAAILLSSGVVHAQGYFSFGEIPGLDAKPTVQIDLNPAMLGFVMEAAKSADPQAADVLAGITNVRVNVYEHLGDKLDVILKYVDSTSSALERDGWHAAVRVNEGEEQVRVFVKTDPTSKSTAGSSISGITMMVTDGSDEAVFVNIGGQIQASQLGKIAGALGMEDALEPLKGLGNLSEK